MKERIPPLAEEQPEPIPLVMQNLFEEPSEDTSFDFSKLDELLGESEDMPEAAEQTEEQVVSSEEPAMEPETVSAGEAAAPSIPEDPIVSSEPETQPPKTRSRLLAAITASKKAKGLAALAVVLLLLLLSLAGVLIAGALDPFDNRMLDNTTIGGIQVGGMTRWEAYKAVKAATADTFTQQNMEVMLPDATISLTPDQTKAKLSVWPTVREAFRLGRKGTDEEKQAAVSAAAEAGTNIDLLPHMKLEQDYIRTQLEEYAVQYNIAYTEVTYQLTGAQPPLSEDAYKEDAPGQTLQLTMGTPLVELDVEEVLAQILEAYNRNSFCVTIDTISPTTVPPQPDLEAISQEFLIAPVDAGVDLVNYTIVPGSYGYGIDLEAAQKLIAEADYGQTISIPMKYTAPEILGDGVYFRDELGYCETPHTNNENRNTNLRLACEALDGHIIQPGEEFSYNTVLGERTAAKGYKPAPAYSGTDTVNSIGGGVCQGSSTLYYAALVADLEITERRNHGFRSTYIPIGLDATVSWWGPDFKFVNNYHFPIMIKAEVSDGFMKMWIYGTDEKDYYVVLESKITGYDEAKTVYKSYAPGSGYYNGQVISGGTDGIYAKSYSCKYDKETDELISKDEIAWSSYMRIDRVIAKVGK